ncbi:coactosin-like protein [Melitaea cinxia]|uniref:coactosin-like protein n=1 Tax=Melitaea cinxia TaxID=113334 RepID=UPI001E2740EF|nr:coactosin-like protein [Melitaea cinxia]
MNLDTDRIDKQYTKLQNQIDKLSNSQNNVINKFDLLTKNVDDMKKILNQFAEKITLLEDATTERRKLSNEMKILKSRVDELYTIVKDGKESSVKSDDVQDVDSCHSGFSCSSKVTMTTGLDRDTIRAAYEDVRSDNSPTEWAVFKFEGARIICSARGSDFSEFRTQFSDDDRAFGYLRMQMGDEMSKRKKFMFVTWVGPNVSVINRAKMSTDKAIIKDIISNFAVELQLENQAEIDIDQFKEALNRAGGANYGTGVRDL